MTSESQVKSQKSPQEPSVTKTIEPSTPPKNYTQGEVEKLVAGVQSGLDKKVDALTKTIESNKTSNETLKTQLKDASTKIALAEKAREEAEFNSVDRTNPDALAKWSSEQALKQRARDLDSREADINTKSAQFETDMVDVKEFKSLQAASEIASRDEFKGVKATDLTSLTDGSPDKMEALAKILVIANTTPTQTPTQDPEIPPDPGQNVGGAGQLSIEQMDVMSPEDYNKHPSNADRFKDTYEQSKGV